MQPRRKTPSIAEEVEVSENNYETRSTTRASGSTSLKRKSKQDEKDAKKMTTGANTVIIMHNPTIHTQYLGTTASTTNSPRTPPSSKEAPTVQSTPRAT
eukprot:2310611-Amphidinium_carterae.1